MQQPILQAKLELKPPERIYFFSRLREPTMTTLYRACPTVALATVLTGALLAHPAASQTPSTPAQPSAHDAVLENSVRHGHPGDTRLELSNSKSVLGIEVRSSHEKNIGRIIDLLANRGGGVEAAVIEFGGFLGIGTRKIAIAWSTLRFESDGKHLVAILDIPRDQLRAAPDYKPDRPTVVTKAVQPVLPAVEEPPHKVTQPPPLTKEKPTSKRKREPRRDLH
jgi:PRC-barrel domain